MTTNIDQLAEELVALPKSSRIYLAERLLESVDGFADDATAGAWKDEVVRRIRELEEGTAKGIPVTEAIQQARQRLAKHGIRHSSGSAGGTG